MAFEALGDLAKIQVSVDEYNFGNDDRGTAESGILVSVPEKFTHYGMWSFAFEESLVNPDKLKVLSEYWKTHIGHRVYWTALAEKGNIISVTNEDGVTERYAFVKFTSLIAYNDDPEAEGRNAHADGGGSFNMGDGLE